MSIDRLAEAATVIAESGPPDLAQWFKVGVDAYLQQGGPDLGAALGLSASERSKHAREFRNMWIRRAAAHIEGTRWNKAKKLAAIAWRATRPLNKGSSELTRCLHEAAQHAPLPSNPKQFDNILAVGNSRFY